MLYAHRFATRLGPMLSVVDDDGALVVLHFGDDTDPADAAGEWMWSEERCSDVVAQVTAYLDGRLREFTLAVAPRGTAFQQRVWQELRRVPFGTTISYAELAARVGSRGGSRAVGQANGANPVAIVIPCHRVIAASGALSGYAGGVGIKRALLELEGRLAPAAQLPLLEA